MRIIAMLVVLAACSKSGDYKAARASYCKSVDANHQEMTTAFVGIEVLGQALDRSDALLPACNEALGHASEALGYLRGLSAGEGALYAGAPDTTADRAPFTVASHPADDLIQLSIAQRAQLLAACEQNKRDDVKAWLDRAKQAHKDVDARFDRQVKDCAAVAK